MPSDYVYAEIQGQKIKLTNPDKILYPEAGIVKAQFIKYLLDISPYLLPLIKQRPLTLIRYPDGIQGKKFYSKNKPTWSPEWIHSTLFPGDDDNHYVMIDDIASLAWIGNLAALEIHPMNVRSPNLNFPDQFIFDLDPSTEVDFATLKSLALGLKSFLENKGFVPFIKTSGGKGLHIYVPIKPVNTIEEVYLFVKKMALEYVTKYDKNTTLKISKAQRKGKVLLDIYRNSKAQSCVAPYSVRAKPGAPVSTPFSWDQLEEVNHSQQWNINNILTHIEKNGNPWLNFSTYAATLFKEVKKGSETLKTYAEKRNFLVTNEPLPEEIFLTAGNEYVIQLHDASNLHYDLRLEENGVLISWAIPKGLPEKPGIKRLAIRTEDHPLKYLRFEGSIPKNEYGGGQMWVFDKGQYQLIKKSKNKYHFRLTGGKIQGEYVMIHTKEKQWIIEKKDAQSVIPEQLKDPMLAILGKRIPNKKDCFFEIKWDGIRAIFIIENGALKIYSRNGNDITDQFPKLQSMTEAVEAETAVLDGEIVHLDAQGKPLFHKIVGRIHSQGEQSIKNAANKIPAVVYLFDLLYLDGKDCRNEYNTRRREWLKTILTTNQRIRFSESFEDGKTLFNAIKTQGMEGIMCKTKTGKYLTGQRSSSWKKIKLSLEDTAYVIGYTMGEGDRAGLFGALHLAKKQDGELIYMGKVGTGFSNELIRDLMNLLKDVPEISKPIKDVIVESAKSIWIKPEYVCNIKYASLSSNSSYREPVFIKMRKEQ